MFDDTKPLPDSMLTNHRWDRLAFFTGNAQDTYPWYEFGNYWFNITAVSSRGQWVKEANTYFCWIKISLIGKWKPKPMAMMAYMKGNLDLLIRFVREDQETGWGLEHNHLAHRPHQTWPPIGQPFNQSGKAAWWRHQMETFSALLAICARTKASDAELWCFLWCPSN